MRHLIRALRPYQWSKNTLVFAALVFAQRLDDAHRVLLAVAAFGTFCAASSAVYLVNDIVDRHRDQRHPHKAQRPIASGELGTTTAAAAAAVLAGVALAGAWAIHVELAATIGGYFLLQAAYNALLKRIAIIDALCVATGFLLRAVAGAAAIQEPMSSWLLICTSFGSIFISFAKRRHEVDMLAHGAGTHRESLASYSIDLLDQFLVISAAATVLSYALYTTDEETIAKFGGNSLILTLPFVIFGLFRYLTLVHKGASTGDPARLLVQDRPLLVSVALWAAVVVVIIYVR